MIVEAEGGGHRGLGYTYAAAAAARLIDDMLGPVVRGMDCMGSEGPRVRPAACLPSWLSAGSRSCLRQRGFTSYPVERLPGQFADWAAAGITRLKMKVGRDFEADRARVEAARNSIGNRPELFVDANGAYTRKQALAQAEAFAGADVTWFEEPVSSDDLEGLRLIRDRAPAGMDIAAGEYGYDLHYFRRMLDAGAVDILQADATRCAGITGFLRVGALCQAASVQLSAHTAPALHLHPCCALAPVVHIEWFHDHARIERMLFEGAIQPVRGVLSPDRSRPGMGLELRRSDAAEFLVYGRDAERAVR